MKPITSKVKKSCSPLKQTTDDKKITGKGKGEQGQLQEYSVTGKPASETLTQFKPGSKAFDNAFGAARKAGLKTFQFGGKTYGTEMFKPEKIVTPGNVNVEISEPKTQASEGTVSDVYTTFDQRKYGLGGRSEKIALRQERKAGRQDMRRLEKAKKHGVITEGEYETQMKQAKANRYGQGEQAKAARAMMSDPKNALIQSEQRMQKKTPRLSTYTRNFEVPTKASKGGESIMAPEGMESTSSQVNKAKEDILNNSSGNVLKNKSSLFAPQKFSESVMGDTKSAAEMKSSALKMVKGASPFKMKGYGKKGC
jgi:hypothetical protein